MSGRVRVLDARNFRLKVAVPSPSSARPEGRWSPGARKMAATPGPKTTAKPRARRSAKWDPNPEGCQNPDSALDLRKSESTHPSAHEDPSFKSIARILEALGVGRQASGLASSGISFVARVASCEVVHLAGAQSSDSVPSLPRRVARASPGESFPGLGGERRLPYQGRGCLGRCYFGSSLPPRPPSRHQSRAAPSVPFR